MYYSNLTFASNFNAGTSIILGNATTPTPISLIGNLTIMNSDIVIPLKRPDAPALAINTWSSGWSSGSGTVGLQITNLKAMTVTAVGYKSGVLFGAGNLRNFAIYNASGTIVGGPYQIDKTVLDSTGAFVRFSIPPFTLLPGIYYFATTLNTGDYYNGDTVANSYTAFDSSVISAFTDRVFSLLALTIDPKMSLIYFI